MNYFFIVLAIVFIIYIFISLKKNDFSIEESVFWILGSIVLLLLSINYKKLDSLAEMLKIHYAPSLVFLIAIMFLLYMNFRSTKKIIKLNEKIINLSQKVSILEYELKKRGKCDEEKEYKRKNSRKKEDRKK